MTDTAILVGLIVAILGLTGTVGVAVLTAKQKGLTDLVAALQAEVDKLRDKASDNEARIAKLERRDRQWANYVHVLRRHITDQKPPPPPEWPPGLDV